MAEFATITLELFLRGPLLDESGVAIQAEDGTDIEVEEFVDVTNDVIAPIRANYGITGVRPIDRVANSGSLTFNLNNSEANSASTLGYYSPDNANVRGDFELGVACMLKVAYGGTTYTKFRGTLREIKPIGGKHGKRTTGIRIVDWLADAAEWKLDLLAVSTNQRADQVISSVLANMTKQPISTSLAEGQSTFAYVGDGLKDEKTTALAAINKAVLSEFGFAYVIGDTSDGGKFVFSDRHGRVTDVTVDYTLTEDDIEEIVVVRHDNMIFNFVKATSYPRDISAAATEVLYNLPNPINITPGDTVTVVGRYRDPDQTSARISGTEMVTPVADTDYKFGSAEGGGSNDLNANLGIVATYGANSVRYALTNNATIAGYLNLLQARGKAIRLFDPQISESSDATSRTIYGDRPLDLNLLYQDDPLEAQDFADITKVGFKDPKSFVDKISFIANKNTTTMAAAVAGEPGDRIQLSETVTGIDGEYFIDGVELQILDKFVWRVTWHLRDATSDAFWLLGTSGSSEIGETTYLGF